MSNEIICEESISNIISIGGENLHKELEYLREIHLEKLLLVEGSDEVNFFHALVKNLSITGLEIRDYGGKNRLTNNLAALFLMRGFEKVNSLGIIRDSDKKGIKGSNSALQSIQGILKKIKDDKDNEERFKDIPIPEENNKFSLGSLKLGIFIMNPMLEALCLETVKGTTNMDCVNVFFNCLNEKNIIPNNKYKARVLAFLATKEKTKNCLGIAAHEDYWDFQSQCMDNIKSFIKELTG